MLRPLPNLPCWLWLVVCGPIFALIPAAVLMSELLFLVKSIWRESYYLMYLFFLMALILTIIATAIISVLHTYLLIKRGYHDWQWRSYITGFYVFYYVIEVMQMYYYKVLSADSMRFNSGNFIFIVFSVFTGTMIGLIGGSASYLSSFYFLKYIYS